MVFVKRHAGRCSWTLRGDCPAAARRRQATHDLSDLRDPVRSDVSAPDGCGEDSMGRSLHGTPVLLHVFGRQLETGARTRAGEAFQSR
jgi:hypothetical protein